MYVLSDFSKFLYTRRCFAATNYIKIKIEKIKNDVENDEKETQIRTHQKRKKEITKKKKSFDHGVNHKCTHTV